MKSLGAILLTCFFIVIPVHAETIESNTLTTIDLAVCSNQTNLAGIYVLEKRGCCSHHSGVCGCSGGRVTCCDGTYSPSCTCYKEDTFYINKISTDGA